MKDKNKINSIAPLHYQYPFVSKDDIPENFNKLILIDYKSKEIEEYEVLFFHRLMKKNYGDPPEIEFEPTSIKKLEDGRVKGLGREWKYYIRTHSGGIIQIGTERMHTRLKVCHVLQDNQEEVSNLLIEEGKKFINDLLKEAQKLNRQLLNIQKEFEGDENVRAFFLDNVYLTNYRSAELMVDHAEENEQIISYEFCKHDAVSPLTPEQEAHIEKYRPALGMYYAASISYFFMALEGFINIIYYAFLKDEVRADFFTEQKLNERLDLNAKMLLMPSLCNGFKSKQKAGFFKDLTRLKNYRNFFFHSKITDSLKGVVFFESGFLYDCDLKKDCSGSFPSRKQNLDKGKALEFKKVVDSIIEDILDMMQDETSSLIKKIVLNNLEIPFWRDEHGAIFLKKPS